MAKKKNYKKKNYKQKKYQKQKAYRAKTSHNDPMKAVLCTVFAILFTIAFLCMWIGICVHSVLMIVVCAILTALCAFLAIYKWVKSYRNYSGA